MRLAALLLAVSLAGCCSHRGLSPVNGIDNLDRVDSALMRGAQPSNLGLEALKAMGVKSVLNLRNDPLPGEASTCAALGLVYDQWALSGLTAPKPGTIAAILDVIETAPKPCFVHCQFGADRTGLIVGCYRVRHGWKAEDAVKDAKAHGLETPGFAGAIRAFK